MGEHRHQKQEMDAKINQLAEAWPSFLLQLGLQSPLHPWVPLSPSLTWPHGVRKTKSVLNPHSTSIWTQRSSQRWHVGIMKPPLTCMLTWQSTLTICFRAASATSFSFSLVYIPGPPELIQISRAHLSLSKWGRRGWERLCFYYGAPRGGPPLSLPHWTEASQHHKPLQWVRGYFNHS